MPKDVETIKNDAAVAQFRFALIAPVVQGLYPDASATAYYKRVTQNPLTLPDGSSISYSYKTQNTGEMEIPVFHWWAGGSDAFHPFR